MLKRISLLALALAGCTDDYYSDDSTQPIPSANDDHVMLVEDQSFNLQSLAANDVDVLKVKVISGPEHGTIVNGQYEPQPGYFGPDKLTYEGRYSEYGGESAQATAYFSIESDGIGYEQSRVLADTNASDLLAADLDGDGKIDLVSCDSQLNEMTVFRNRTASEGQFDVEPFRFEGGSKPIRLALADLDRDGRIDIVTAAFDGLTIFRNITQPQGELAFAGPERLGSMVTYGVVAADIDADGDPDLAAIENSSQYSAGKLHVWLNTSTQGVFSFGTPTTFATPVAPTRIAAIDADGDDRSDLAVLADDKLSLYVNATAAGAAVAAFNARVDRATAPEPISMFLVDLDGDAQREIGVLHDSGNLWIYANRRTASPSFEAARVLEVPYSTVLVAPAELDGDGVIDLLGAAGGTSAFSFLHNRSQPQAYDFELAEAKIADVETRKAATFAVPTALVFVDLDGVAPLEIVVASRTGYSSTSGSGGLRVLFGR